MSEYYVVAIQKEPNGTFSASVPGVSGVYAAADTASQAKRAIRSALKTHLGTLAELGQSAPAAPGVNVLKRTASGLEYVGLGALLGTRKSPAKAAASRANGRKGGRPRKKAVSA